MPQLILKSMTWSSISFQTTAKVSRLGHAHPDFFQGGRLPPAHPVLAPMAQGQLHDAILQEFATCHVRLLLTLHCAQDCYYCSNKNILS